MFCPIPKLCFVSVSLITGAGKVRVQSPDHPLPRQRVPVPRHLLVLTGHRGDHQVHRHRAALYQPEDDRQALQIQLGPQAVQRHPCQVGVGQRGRPDHPQSTLAGQETRECTEEVRKMTLGIVSVLSTTVGQDPIISEMTDMSLDRGG